MIPYLVICSLLIPVNLWAAITPHLHSQLSMQILHGLSTWCYCPCCFRCSAIALLGMGVGFGCLDHLYLALGALSIGADVLLETRASVPFPAPMG